MAIRIRRQTFDFLAKDYKTRNRSVEILHEDFDRSNIDARRDDKKNKVESNNFVQRWYVGLQGEDSPLVSSALASGKAEGEPLIYRYDWAYGVTVIEGLWWDWQGELRNESAIVVQLLLKALGDAAEFVPIGGTLSALRPSRNTKGLWETAMPQIPKLAAELTSVGKAALPQLEYASKGLFFASNVLESYTEKEKNWFLYQFLNEEQKCPAVEWRISKRVLAEYGPLLRGTLYGAFYGPAAVEPAAVRIQLRAGIGYLKDDDLVFIWPIDSLGADQQMCIDVRPRAAS